MSRGGKLLGRAQRMRPDVTPSGPQHEPAEHEDDPEAGDRHREDTRSTREEHRPPDEPEHHDVLRMKRQGLEAPEIAARTGLHEDSVRRLLRQLARRLALQPPAPPAAP